MMMEEAIGTLVGQKVELETTDGMQRHGVLTDVTWNTVEVNGQTVRWPKGLVLGGDKSDELPWLRLKEVHTL